ncbi:NADPH-dependent F420 reductase [Komagataeibacter rhaeticus]
MTNIGIIGAGNVGSTLAKRLSDLGHHVKIANSRGPTTLRSVADQTGAKAVTLPEVVQDVQIIVIAIPEKNIPLLKPSMFRAIAPNTVIVDAGNYYPRQRDGRIAAIEQGTPESCWVEAQIGRPVVKAFNNVHPDVLMRIAASAGDLHRVALPVAGDDVAAKKAVMCLIKQLGLDAVDAGSLAESWRQQPGSPAYLTDLDAVALRDALINATSIRMDKWTATPDSPGSFVSPA